MTWKIQTGEWENTQLQIEEHQRENYWPEPSAFPKKLYDEVREWKPTTGRILAQTRVQVFLIREEMRFVYLAILTEPPDNPGMSITNGIRFFVDEMFHNANVDQAEFIFVEHYERPAGSELTDTWDFWNPRGHEYKFSTWEVIAGLIGAQGKWSDL